jgi:hypothetical protein
MPLRRLLLALLLPLVAGVGCSAVSAQQTSATPDQARLITADAERFWQVWDAHGGKPDAAALQAGYLDPGTPGLAAFLRLRIGSAEQLAKSIAAHPDYYASLRGIHVDVAERREEFVAAFAALEALYPSAVFPDVYFLIGAMNSAGTLAEEGLLIGLDMHGRKPGVDLSSLSSWHQAVLAPADALPNIVAHELVHYQQLPFSRDGSLLQAAVGEGAADFIAERIAGAHINAALHDYGRANECALWREFEPRMHGTDIGGFLYEGDAAKGRPADTGYFIGYRIVEAYVARKGLSEASLREVLGGLAADALLREGGYAPCADSIQPHGGSAPNR